MSTDHITKKSNTLDPGPYQTTTSTAEKKTYCLPQVGKDPKVNNVCFCFPFPFFLLTVSGGAASLLLSSLAVFAAAPGPGWPHAGTAGPEFLRIFCNFIWLPLLFTSHNCLSLTAWGRVGLSGEEA